MTNFVGKFYGKYYETKVISKPEESVETKKGLAVCTIKEVGKHAYLISILEDEQHTITNLAYMENNVLRSISKNGSGITSTYFDSEELIHQISIKIKDGQIVKIFKFAPYTK